MKIFMGNSPWVKPGYFGVRAGSRWPHFEKKDSSYIPFPFFLAYATSLLEKNGFEVRLADGIAERIGLEEFLKRIGAYKPDLVVYEVSTPSIDHDLQVARQTKERLGKSVKVLFCGPHFGMYNSEFLESNHDVDMVIQGEYEFTLLEVLQKMRRKEPVEDVKGLILRDRSGRIVVNDRRPLHEDLDEFPWPARSQLRMEKYCDMADTLPAPSLQMWASRGCPYHCVFCAWPQIMYDSSRYRVRDPKDVVDEMEWCIGKYGFKSVYFDDDTFNIGKTRMLRICEEIKTRRLNVPWAIMARADGMDREILSAMRGSGLIALKYGVESGVQEILNNTGKSLDLQRVKETVEMTRELGIKIHLTFTFGLPGETLETIGKTIDLAMELDPDSLQFSIVTPFPGSKYFEALDKKGYILTKDWDNYDGYNRAVIRTDHLTSAELETALRKANRRWKKHVLFRMLKNEPVKTAKFVICNPVKCASAYYR